ncbi:zinc ribbon domain-containing protein [Christensenellaceae bacterium OttesenSCG-928-M15]|nr:zinc ribbon domain-containing protein [Christensenellaceae bacterium OttesenSCG-928-M15]
MNGFSRFSKKLGKLAGNASRKSGELVEAAKLNSEINRLQMDIEDLQFELGNAYYQENKDNPVDPYADYIAQIRQCEQEIGAYEEKLLALKGLLYCPACGEIVDGRDEFCSKCGAPVPETAEKKPTELCRNCQESMEEGELYCSQCGFLLKS